MTGLKDHFFGDEIYVPPFQAHSTTSREAARAIAGHTTRLQQRVLDYLEQHPEGATDEKLGDALGLGGSTLRPRRRELQLAGRIIEHPTLTGKTKAGITANLWILKPQLDQPTPSKWWQHD